VVRKRYDNTDHFGVSAHFGDVVKVIVLKPSSYLGYQLKYAALHGAHRYDEAIEAFEIMLSKLDNAPDTQLRSKLQTVHLLRCFF
jgi:hypothetical protein